MFIIYFLIGLASGALGAMLDLGHGSGPMDHGFELKGVFCQEDQ